MAFSFEFIELNQCSSLWLGLLSSHPPPPCFPSTLFVQCDGYLENWHGVLMAGLRRLPAMGLVLYQAACQLVGFPVKAPQITQAPNFYIAIQL